MFHIIFFNKYLKLKLIAFDEKVFKMHSKWSECNQVQLYQKKKKNATADKRSKNYLITPLHNFYIFTIFSQKST